jgi:opacity protein-like surface antigen
MKKKLYVVFLLSICFALQLVPHRSAAQGVSFLNRKLEVGLNIGPSNFLGDLGGNVGRGKTFLKDNNVELTKLITGAYVAYYPAEWLGLRLSFQKTTIEGDDKVIDRKGGLEEARKNRNLSFRSPLTELYIGAEFYPTVFFEYDDYLAKKFRPYAVAGVGIFKFNPQAQLNGEWIDLKPLRTEGQGFPGYTDRKEYGLTQVAFPIGLGFKYFFNENFSAGIEAIHRFTTTDYIDDVSTKYINPSLFDANLSPSQAALAKQLHDRRLPSAGDFGRYNVKRGDPKQNDGYYSLALKLGWRLGDPNASEWRQARRQVRCYY